LETLRSPLPGHKQAAITDPSDGWIFLISGRDAVDLDRRAGNRSGSRCKTGRGNSQTIPIDGGILPHQPATAFMKDKTRTHLIARHPTGHLELSSLRLETPG
jgi:hypothetical protein